MKKTIKKAEEYCMSTFGCTISEALVFVCGAFSLTMLLVASAAIEGGAA